MTKEMGEEERERGQEAEGKMKSGKEKFWKL